MHAMFFALYMLLHRPKPAPMVYRPADHTYVVDGVDSPYLEPLW